MQITEDTYMQRALELAAQAGGYCYPNPKVGCVIVKDGKIISEGYHRKYGEYHAERMAILNSKESVENSEVYVTLEPCSHTGKQPPCADLLIESKVKRVIIANADPDTKVNGKGIEKLKDSGIEVHLGILNDKAYQLNEDYFYHRINQVPYVVGKIATSIDGKTSTFNKKSQWITNEKSRQYSHYLRSRFQAIMVGASTFNEDNPKLNVRINDGKDYYNPIKIIVTSSGKINLNHDLFKERSNNIIICTTPKIDFQQETKLNQMGCTVLKIPENDQGQVDIKLMLKELGKRNIVSIYLEGGSALLESFIKLDLLQKLLVFMGNQILGGLNNGIINSNIYPEISNSPSFVLNQVRTFENNVMLDYYTQNYYKKLKKQLCLPV
ncbi:bifunctional diaminohydroxyphosphoribosylaminopyrimidine deaminase/5-amino-6-(5-phosphoribosylamino)uracil reductase RibD [Apibacter muscae]|uniref:bifunctional diaminohydroxyphosphoribosylaminopyrimidine deaminase/5-amino-6-(5-phosphoribosylamino)uracil reductase RibD n=1 Tax=Apibacter muscae TaxID=2509004 RepID=UPI0011AC2BE2|nr:bifunctional diaminohydroxyphosphoribosylaminopyrimidine deaminase/5-amino-6-(5-phosphoribosylamino)uracil reductase RibD [Apibacter muscae]TWP22881.1 bifunctional diaminohydroxyphosphoribosylaminopyrimidine deaminase/5-amino-6-(5-phosphoribosylamino)uracil reductase RibD [Apibacter muscae]